MRVAWGYIIIRDLCHFVKIICLIWGDYLKSLEECQRTRGLSFVIAEQELLDK